MGGATHLGRELSLGVLRGPQVLHEFLIFHRALKREQRDIGFSYDAEKSLTFSFFFSDPR